MTSLPWLVPLGFIVGTFGTLIGAGGGFILVPVLILIYPHDRPEVLTGISLTVVFFNAASGSLAYARQKRIDYRAAFIFSAAAIPGAILGAISTASVPRHLFDGILGVLMIAGATALIFLPRHDQHPAGGETMTGGTRGPAAGAGAAAQVSISLDSPQTVTGVLISAVVGYVSSLLGIGGGIVHVPALIRILKFPVHVATATSHMILAIMALAGVLVHVTTGTFGVGLRRTAALSLGIVFGAQVGAYISRQFRGRWIIRGLAMALVFVGARVLTQAFRQ
jgi:uncharacterized membrane protein YfcA